MNEGKQESCVCGDITACSPMKVIGRMSPQSSGLKSEQNLLPPVLRLLAWLIFHPRILKRYILPKRLLFSVDCIALYVGERCLLSLQELQIPPQVVAAALNLVVKFISL
jgi:hypothetical protein